MSNSLLRQPNQDPHPPELRWELQGKINVTYSVGADGVTTREGFQNWTQRLAGPNFCFFPQQEHGKHIVVLDEANLDLYRSTPPKADGFATRLNIGLGVWGSDCPGLAISCGDGAFGVAHCGWRGTAKEIALVLIEHLKNLSPAPISNWEAVIGPGICQNCYEVDEPVLKAYSWPKQSLAPSPKFSHAHLNLKSCIQHQLENAGIGKITVSPTCTAEDLRMHSFRHRGPGPNQVLMAWPRNIVSTKTII